MSQPRRPLHVAIVQSGQATDDLDLNLKTLLELFEEAATPETDLVVFPELATTPYFCGTRDQRFSPWAQPIPGPVSDAFGQAARRLDTAVVFGTYETTGTGALYNSAVVIDRDGELVHGRDLAGRAEPAYRKMSIPANNHGGVDVDEKFYFTPGPGPLVFELLGTRFACVICYDRSFPEHWMAARAMGAEVMLTLVSSLGFREQLFTAELQVRALETQLWVLAANRGGAEECNGSTSSYFGLSCVVNPAGDVVVQAPAHSAGDVIRTVIDLQDVPDQRAVFPLGRDRRPGVLEAVTRAVSQP